MADNDGQQQGDQGEEKPHDLRRQLEEEKARNKELASKNKAFEQDEQLREAGLSHLTKKQRRSVLRDLADDGVDFTPEAALEAAKELGYSLEGTPPPKDQGQQGQQSQQQGNGQQSQGDEGDDAEDALSALGLMERAKRAAASNQVNPDFIKEMEAIAAKHPKDSRAAKQELTDLIRSKGPRHGIIHEWDVP
jgi:hypothetical protein